LSTAACYIDIDSCFTQLPDVAHIQKTVRNKNIPFPTLDPPTHLPPTTKINLEYISIYVYMYCKVFLWGR